MVRPVIILIGGGSGSGKTTLAEEIKDALKGEDIEITIISMDRFYIGLEEMERKGIGRNFDDPRSLNWEELKETLKEVRKGKKDIILPVYSFIEHRRIGMEKVRIGDVIILEGIWALLKKEILEMADLRIYVDTPADIRLSRRVRRDILERGRDVNGVVKQYIEQVRPMHYKYVEPTKEDADIIIPGKEVLGEKKYNKAVELIVGYIKKRLEQ